MSRVLCLAAHPDDLEVYMGGALLGFCEAGVDLHAWIATRGEAGSLQPRVNSGGGLDGGSRVDEARAAFGSLGYSMQVEGLEDGGLAREQDLERILSDRIQEHRPELLFAPHASDAHADHAALGACIEGMELGSDVAIWQWMDASPTAQPGHFLDLGSSIAAKLALIGYHKSQIPGPDGPRDHLPDGRDILQRAEHRDRGYGVRQGRAWLEPFLAPRSRRGEAPCILESVRGFFPRGGRGTG